MAYLLSERTGTWWRITDCGVGVEILPPYRTCIVRGYSALRLAFADHSIAPCALQAEMSESLGTPATPFVPADSFDHAGLLSALVAVPQSSLDGGVALTGRFLQSGAVENRYQSATIID